jgi:hypothetical protein
MLLHHAGGGGRHLLEGGRVRVNNGFDNAELLRFFGRNPSGAAFGKPFIQRFRRYAVPVRQNCFNVLVHFGHKFGRVLMRVRAAKGFAPYAVKHHLRIPEHGNFIRNRNRQDGRHTCGKRTNHNGNAAL